MRLFRLSGGGGIEKGIKQWYNGNKVSDSNELNTALPVLGAEVPAIIRHPEPEEPKNGSSVSRMRGGLKKADILILIGVTFNQFQERDQHVHEFTIPCLRGSRLQVREDRICGG